MKVHNIMEEYVASRVNMFYEKLNEENTSRLMCDCDVCRSDTLGFVLNRIPPRYVVSSRGMIHNSELMDDAQLRTDVDTLISRGAHIINSVQRPYHSNKAIENSIEETSKLPLFNFPVFSGKVYNGETFEEMPNVKITLKSEDGMTAEMVDFTWENPCMTHKVTNGSYTFWVKSLPAEKAGITKNFNFTISAEYEGYVSVTHGFEVTIKSDDRVYKTGDSTFSFKIHDLFMFKPVN